ncbi:glycosyltransferase family 2 protein [Flavobacterium sp. F-380]|uniref:Glycosyltransferase family 2 protein n=1 Tax=Flavobacterium kayseriense TaxID=2764714 RepID=A0ABR7J7I5_9FLAO|nr:glycosyltransferase family 2 protein [Flavobacterium kayseriense]MBC5841438.1 glycosyltransferase family 2 protein [Flavobacterium kayseriense]MBC5847966.1 glycosyltransferase family 2 protein [Flavobacterium kayseriense]
MKSLVSIIIPCYNQDKFLDETLQSVFNQSCTNWECIIVNDGSIDRTEIIATEWVAKDNRFIYTHQVNKGVSAARNIGLMLAEGEYIQFLDADDVLAVDKIQVSLEAIFKNNVQVCCCNYSMFTNSTIHVLPPFSKLASFEFNFENLARYWNDGFTIPIHCWLFKTDLFADVAFPDGLNAQEDWIVWLRIFKKSPKTFYIDKHLAFYRLNPNGRTQTGGFFNETLEAIHYLKEFLNETDFRLLYESAIVRNNIGMLYWRKREVDLKKSNTYQFGLLCKKIIKKIGLLKSAKAVFEFLNPLK